MVKGYKLSAYSWDTGEVVLTRTIPADEVHALVGGMLTLATVKHLSQWFKAQLGALGFKPEGCTYMVESVDQC